MPIWLTKLKERWSGLPANRRTVLILVVAGVMAGLLFIGQWAGREKYVALFSNLEPREALEIVGKLKEEKVPYQLVADGGTIMVPESKVYDLRLEVAGSGLLAGSGVGFELFDKAQLGMTDRQWHLNYQRALQEELRRTIVQCDQIEQARVHLVMSEPSVFLEDARPSSAAVLVKLRPMAALSAEQVRAIMHLVASSVENMQPQDVRVVDTQGHVLSEGVLPEGGVGEVTLASASQQELRHSFEQNLERRVQQKLETVLGAGNVVVMVTADLDFDSREVTRILYDNPGVVSNEELVEDTASSSGGASLPPVGDLNRQPESYVQSSSGAGQASRSRTETTRNYELSRTEEKVITAPGRLRRLATAVVVNGPLDAVSQQQIQNIVAAATGYDAQRGDQISLMSMAFDRKYQSQMEQEMAREEAQLQRQKRWQQYLIWGAAGAALLLLLLLGLRIARGRRVPATLELGTALETAVAVEDTGLREEEERLTVVDQVARSKLEKAKETAQQHPEETVQLLKAWLGED